MPFVYDRERVLEVAKVLDYIWKGIESRKLLKGSYPWKSLHRHAHLGKGPLGKDERRLHTCRSRSRIFLWHVGTGKFRPSNGGRAPEWRGLGGLKKISNSSKIERNFFKTTLRIFLVGFITRMISFHHPNECNSNIFCVWGMSELSSQE